MAGKSDRRRKKKRTGSLGIGRFFRWWKEELAYFVPRGLRMGEKPSRQILWLGFNEESATLWRFSGNSRSEIGGIDLSGEADERKLAFDVLIDRAGKQDLGISLSPAQVLRREVSVPMAARDNLRQVLHFEMDRQTPYSGDQVYFRHETVGEHADNKSLNVRITVVPRGPVDKAIAYLREWGRPPLAIAASDELRGDGHYANLLPDEMRPKRGPWRAVLVASMASITLALLAALLLIPVWQKRETVIALHPVVASASQRAEASNLLKTRLEAELAHYNFLPEKKLKTVTTVALIDELTRLLPDDTWVQQMDVHGRELQIQGETGSSARLIGLFEQSRLLGDASFRSPLTKGRGVATAEQFQLIAVVKDIPLADALASQRAITKRVPRPRGRMPAEPTAGQKAVRAKGGLPPQPARGAVYP